MTEMALRLSTSHQHLRMTMLVLIMDTIVYALTVSNWSPSLVALHGVSQSYPDSFWRTLTSSVPRREFALNEVSLVFQPSHINLLLGESSSGKSTILRLIMGWENPVSGTMDVSSQNATIWRPRPVYLDSRPLYSQNAVVEDIWKKAFSKGGEQVVVDEKRCLDQLSKLLGVPTASKTGDLPTSKVYLCRLGEACLESMVMNFESPMNGIPSPLVQVKSDNIRLPSPILLLDEWLDNETSTVVRKVQDALEGLAQNGAVIICVTHKPHLFSVESGLLSRVTLSRGKVLSSAS